MQESIIELQNDFPLFGYKKGDRIRVDHCINPVHGSIVIIRQNDTYAVSRFQKINDSESLWPPISICEIEEVLVGVAIKLERDLLC